MPHVADPTRTSWSRLRIPRAPNPQIQSPLSRPTNPAMDPWANPAEFPRTPRFGEGKKGEKPWAPRTVDGNERIGPKTREQTSSEIIIGSGLQTCWNIDVCFFLGARVVISWAKQFAKTTILEKNELDSFLGLQDLQYKSFSPAAAVRVVGFYQSSSFPPGPPPPPRRHLNSKRQIAEGTTGPQPQVPDRSGHYRTSTHNRKVV